MEPTDKDSMSGVRISALNGVRVIDLTSVLMGPYATQFLGDYGADVIKVEPPTGDMVRSVGPSRHSGMGPLFLNSNRSKRSLVLDLKTDAGRQILLDLCRNADVLVYNVRPAAMRRLRLSWDDIHAINSRIIYAGLYGYGQAGRYAARPAYDDLIQGGSTLSHLFTLSGSDEPRYVPAAIADRIVGLTALSGIMAAIIERDRTGRGQRVDVPMFETMVNFVLSDHLGGLTFDPPLDRGGYVRQLSASRRPVRTADGHLCVLLYTDDHWHRFLACIGRAEVMDEDPRFATFASRMDNVDHVYGFLAEVFLKRTSQDWVKILDDADVPVMAMHTLESVLKDEHLNEVGFFRTHEHPTEGRIVSMRNPVQMPDTTAAQDIAAPRLGQHSAEVLRELGLNDQEIEELFASGVSKSAS
ncbi:MULTISPECIES: CaiB/BaiF CoA transferase family protein [Roseobacteraceae]|uniref:Acetyl-CoA:oxalate CoA-transferase n=1 Tax=Pseudosulfitobacter pseudonitzschiae TaxID=1402135 RepID=A0A221K639_9RHOB|nr:MULTISPECIES: CoA transferase [Roseobacteraceae]ASM74350.1 acetyl-CoA:oxalate CoA-transferase [Pseudosulfitobacter pseudonitzschiae]